MPRAARKLTIVGLGATGHSLGLALRAALADVEIVGHDRDPDASLAAKQAGAVDSTHWNLVSACDGAAVVMLALPTRECRSTLEALREELAPGTVVTDTAPLKLPLVRWASQHLPPTVHFVGGHPLAGVDPPRASAFSEATYCLTPTPDTDPEAVAVVSRLVESIGARPAFTDPSEHDGLMWELSAREHSRAPLRCRAWPMLPRHRRRLAVPGRSRGRPSAGGPGGEDAFRDDDRRGLGDSSPVPDQPPERTGRPGPPPGRRCRRWGVHLRGPAAEASGGAQRPAAIVQPFRRRRSDGEAIVLAPNAGNEVTDWPAH